jgi:hypothetical protein
VQQLQSRRNLGKFTVESVLEVQGAAAGEQVGPETLEASDNTALMTGPDSDRAVCNVTAKAGRASPTLQGCGGCLAKSFGEN